MLLPGNQFPSRKPIANAPSSAFSIDTIHSSIINGLAEIRATDVSQIETAITASGGDLEIDSIEGASIIGGLEGKLNRRLLGIEHLDPKQLISVQKLTNLVMKGLNASP